MKRHVYILLILACSLCMADANGQDPFFSITRLGDQVQGMEPACLLQESGGYLLIGSNLGLFRYDGSTISYLPTNDGTIQAISSLYQDRTGNTWAGGSNGHIYQKINDSLYLFTIEEGFPRVPVTGITQTNDSLVWFGTYGEGLYYWNGKRLYNVNMDDGLPDNYIYSVISDQYGNCWAGTDRGLVKCYIEGGKKNVRNYDMEDGLPDLIIKSLGTDENGMIWFGTFQNGIGYINPLDEEVTTPSFINNWEYGTVETLLVHSNIIWAGTSRSGIVEIDTESKGIKNWTHDRNGATFNRIGALSIDNQMNIWAVSYGQLIRSEGRAINHIKNPGSNKSPNSLIVDSEQNLYTAFGDELWFYKYENGQYRDARRINLRNKVNSIISLYEDQYGMIWMGTFGLGIVIYDPLSGDEAVINSTHGLLNENVLDIDGKGNTIWLATLGGAVHIELFPPGPLEGNYNIVNYGEEHGLANNFMYTVYIDTKNRIWFGTDGEGIAMIQEGVINNNPFGNTTADMIVYSITEDHDGNIWFSTSENGIFKAGMSLEAINMEHGIKTLDIRGIMADDIGRLLVVYERGIDVLDISDNHISHISKDGMTGINLNSMMSTGSLAYIGTENGILRLNTAFMPSNILPPTIISGFNLFMDPIRAYDGIKFRHNQNFIGIEYSGIWYAASSDISYQYMLEGQDMEWIATTDNTVSFSNLRPGDYKFRVRSSQDGTFVNANEASIVFSINKPYWLSIWFYVLLALLILSIVFLIIKFRERNLRRMKDLQTEKILFEFETLKSQVSPHFLFNSFSTLASIIDEDKDLAVDFVQKLSTFFRRILENRDKDLITIHEELLMIDNYLEVQKKRFGNTLVLDNKIPFAEQKTLIPPLVLQLLIENALKHNIISSAKPLKIELFIKDRNKIVVKNNLQARKDMGESTGLGITNIRRRYMLLIKKDINVRKTRSEFIVELPLIRK